MSEKVFLTNIKRNVLIYSRAWTPVGKLFYFYFQGGHTITPLPGATPTKPGSAVSHNI